ncbi:hypothetical protein TRIP_B200787 [uncultured Desulfatiglans sp.]|nr:hypothetical protein TRIP_B200787 [uncultured Desulfatiglans sp.]
MNEVTQNEQTENRSKDRQGKADKGLEGSVESPFQGFGECQFIKAGRQQDHFFCPFQEGIIASPQDTEGGCYGCRGSDLPAFCDLALLPGVSQSFWGRMLRFRLHFSLNTSLAGFHPEMVFLANLGVNLHVCLCGDH